MRASSSRHFSSRDSSGNAVCHVLANRHLAPYWPVRTHTGLFQKADRRGLRRPLKSDDRMKCVAMFHKLWVAKQVYAEQCAKQLPAKTRNNGGELFSLRLA